MNKSLCLLLACSWIGVTACKKKAPADPQPIYHGLFVLNEGQWTLSNASIDRIAPTYEQDLFSRVNRERLGDVANFWVREADTLWIVMNGDRLLRKIQLPTFRQIGSLLLPIGASPREFIRLSPDKAYVNSLLDGKIYRIAPQTLQLLPDPILVENYMESLLYTQGRVWVTCGNYAYPTRNQKVACIDPTRDSLLFYVTLPQENPGPTVALPNGEILVGCRGNYSDQKGLLAHLHPSNGQILKTTPLATSVYRLQVYGDKVYMLTDSGITKYDPISSEVDYSFLSKGRLGLSAQELVYGFTYDSVTGRWLVANARYGGVQGEVLWIQPNGNIEQRLEIGVFPSKFLRYP
jgi:hypothetical protein